MTAATHRKRRLNNGRDRRWPRARPRARALALAAALLTCRAAAADFVTNSIGLELAAIPAGSFRMGDETGDWDERPVHRVRISAPFWISTTEVTLEEYRLFRPQHACAFQGKATGVSWHDAVAFCQWLTQREGRPYRLPTEAEWEYACRAGTTSPFWSGTAPPTNAAAANAWGLRGTHDEVMEWCHDWHGPYAPGDATDPVGPAAGMMRVVRGDKPDDDSRLKDEKGRQPADYHRSANRAGLPPGFGVSEGPAAPNAPGCHRVGFRVVQAALPRTRPLPSAVPFVRTLPAAPPSPAAGSAVSRAANAGAGTLAPPVGGPRHLGVAPRSPYFRKRHLLPVPPDNAPDEAIAAAGFPPSFRKHNHSPALEVCANGDVLVILYTSYFEYEPGVSFLAARLRFGQDEWDFPEPMFDTPDVNDHGPLLWTDWTSGRLWFFWGWPKLRAGAFPFQFLTSDDSGASWSDVQFPRFVGAIGPHSRQPINTALRAADGTLYVASDGQNASSLLWATADGGRTWFDPGGRTGGRHTTFALLSDGALLGLGGKSSAIDGYLPQFLSRDGGRSWVTNKTVFPAQGVNQRPSLLRLRSGRLLFAGDFQRRGNLAPPAVTNRGAYVAWSDDEARTWHFKTLPGAQPHERPDLQHEPPTLGYTAARQAPNGMIHLVTTMNRPCLHFEFNEAWLLSDAPTPSADADLMRSRAGAVPAIEEFVERFPDGQLKRRWSGGIADDGRFLKHGTEQWFFPNGTLQYEAEFKLGRKVGREMFYRPDGTPAWQWMRRPDGTAVWTQYWENGRKRSESAWRGTVADGPARTWDREGRLTSQVNFVAGAIP